MLGLYAWFLRLESLPVFQAAPSSAFGHHSDCPAFEVIRPCLEPAVLPRIIQPNWPAHFTDSGTQKNISENHKMPD
jgi:hypothetical protein